jgi:UDP-N-acetylmuramoyl-L-alanyl-D-glutamate--2,6-diaminopimelate ligase
MNSLDLDKYLINSYYLQYPIDIDVTSISFNSKQVKNKGIFVAIKGFSVDGNSYIAEAIQKGASLIVSDVLPNKNYDDVGFLMVDNSRVALSSLSQKLYDFPDKKLKIIAVTGTDGKTSTAFMTYQLLLKNNYSVGLISTTNIDTDNQLIASPYRQSTPDANILFALLADCVDHGKEYVVLEATSHGLSPTFSRLSNIKLDAAIITTITQEHLDFHKSTQAYIESKLNIIKMLKPNGIFITTNKNNKLERCIQRAKLLKKDYLIVEDIIAYTIKEETSLKALTINIDNKTYSTNITLPIFISNALLAILCTNKITHTPLDTLFKNLSSMPQIKGRFNIIENNIGRYIIVDFAHTSDSFLKVFEKLKQMNKRIIALFGSGGDRDTLKRKQMGEVAATFCDIIILSEEDPRFEDNNVIMNNIEEGINQINKNVQTFKIDNRIEAIAKALEISEIDDILIFLGKGHESTIERCGIKYPFDEIKTINEVIRRLYGNNK